MKQENNKKTTNFFHAVIMVILAIGTTLLVNTLTSPTTITGLAGGFGISADVASCGNINQPSTLTANVISTVTCFNITNSSVVFNCQGFNVTGSFGTGTKKPEAGFNITNGSIININITNCNIFNFSYGVWTNRSVNNTIISKNNITNNTWGVYVDGGNLHNITTNNISSNNIAVEFAAGGNGTIDSNVITKNNETGVLLRSLVFNTNITNNSIVDQARPTTELSNPGIVSLRILAARNTLLRDNRIHNYSIQDANVTVWDTNEGRVEFFGFLATDGINLNTDVNITHNRIYVNATTRLGGVGWNVSSGLIFYNLSSLIRLYPLVNVTDDSGIIGVESCPLTGTGDAVTCTIIIDQSENYSFDVNHFSTFSTTESMNCPALLNTTPLIKRTINGTGVAPGQACLTINNNSVNVNCQGYSIIGNASGIAVNITAAGNTTIKNCNILNFTIGINLSSSNTTTISNLNITNVTHAIFLNNTVATISENITANATTGHGIFLINSSNNTFFVSNASNNFGTTGFGFWLNTSSNNVVNNVSAKSVSNFGFYMTDRSNNNAVTFVTAQSDSGEGTAFYVISSAFNNVTLSTGTAGSYGIRVSRSENNTFVNNRGTTTSKPGFALDTNSNNNILINNTGTSTSNPGIILESSSHNNVTANTGRSIDSVGIQINLNANNNTLDRNRAFSDTSFALDVRTSSNNNRFYNNTFFANASVAAFITLNATNNNFTNTTVIGDTGFEINESTNILITNSSFQNTNWSIRAALGSNFSLIDNERMTNYSFNNTPSLTITKTGIASVNFFNIVQANGTNLSIDVNLSINKTHVNTSRSIGLNVSANITLFGLPFTDPQIIVDFEDDGTFELCAFVPRNCTEISYDSGTLIFNVTSFSTYAANETVVQPTPPTPTPPTPSLSGGSSHRTPKITITQKQTLTPTVTPTITTVNTLSVVAPTTATATTAESLSAPSLSLNDPISKKVTDTTDIACGFITNKKSPQEITSQLASFIPKITRGYDAITHPFTLTCNGDDLDLTLNIPNNYTDITALACDGTICKRITETSVTTELICGGYSLEDIRAAQASFKPTSILLSTYNISFQQRIFIGKNTTTISTGNNKLTFTGYYPQDAPVTIFAPQQQLPNPTNPELHLVGTPLTVRFAINENAQIPVTLQLAYPNTTSLDEQSLAIHTLQNKTWSYIDGTLNKNEKTVSTTLNNLLDLLDENKEATFTLIGITCNSCKQATLQKIYDGGSRHAIIFIHGLLSSPTTWQTLLDDYTLTKQPVQLWTFSYSSTQPTQKTAEELKQQLELYSHDYDSISFVSHSLGGFVVQKTLAELSTTPLIDKIKNVILIATPNDGTPAIAVYKQFYNYLAGSKTLAGIFNPYSEVVSELNQGIHLPQQKKVSYSVIAGTQPYDFNTQFFTQPNDGITTTTGAQHLGENYINNTCKNYYQLNLTHTELIYQSLARRIVERIIAQDMNHEKAVGYNQYVRLKINNCQPNQYYVITGKGIPPAAAEAPLNCACGNGICGVNENDVNCPSDCAPLTKTKESICLIMTGAIPALLIILLIITTVYLLLKYVLDKEQRTPKRIVITLFIITLAITIFQTTTCKEPLTLSYFILLAIFAFLFLDTILSYNPPQIKPFNTQQTFANIYNAYTKLAQWNNDIENADKLPTQIRESIIENLVTIQKDLQNIHQDLHYTLRKTSKENKDTINSFITYIERLFTYIKQAKKALK